MRICRLPLPNEIENALALHEVWYRTGGEDGNRADFSGVCLRGYNFDKKDLSYVIFDDADLESADMRYCTFYYTSFKHTNLYNVDFFSSYFLNSNFIGANITFASFRGTKPFSIVPNTFTVYECYNGYEDDDKKTFFDKSSADKLMFDNLRKEVFSYVKEVQLLKS